MHIKHLKHLKHTLQHALATSEEGRVREVQPEKPALGLATQDLAMSRDEVKRRGGVDVDSGHGLLVGNGIVRSTSTRRGTGHGAQGEDQAHCDEVERARWGWSTTRRQTWHGSTRDGGTAVRRLEVGRRRVTCDRRSKELRMSVGCRSIDGVDRGESIDGPVGPGRYASSGT